MLVARHIYPVFCHLVIDSGNHVPVYVDFIPADVDYLKAEPNLYYECHNQTVVESGKHPASADWCADESHRRAVALGHPHGAGVRRTAHGQGDRAEAAQVADVGVETHGGVAARGRGGDRTRGRLPNPETLRGRGRQTAH